MNLAPKRSKNLTASIALLSIHHIRPVLISALLLLIMISFGWRLISTRAAGNISLTTLGTPYTQNFNTLATSGTTNPWADDTTIPGWYSQFSAVVTNPTVYLAGAGTSTTGAIYSFGTGTSTERALGSVASGTPGDIFNAVKLTNNTGATITSLNLSYTGEQWRNGGNTNAQQLDFQYQVVNAGTLTDANTPSTGWTDFDALDFVSPITGATATALDGNAAANRTVKSAILTVTVNVGQEIWLRWKDTNDAGNDHGLAIDDFSVTPNGAVVLPNLTINDVSLNEGNVGTITYTFTVSLSAPAGAGGVTFDIATADNTATQPGDYTLKTLTNQTIPAGSSTYSFTVLVNGDTTPETNEIFFVNVTNVTGANVTDGQGQGTIVNDDAAPNLTINDVSLNEGNSSTTTFTFTVSLSAPAPTGGVTFDIATADNTATSPGDFTAKSLTGQTIPAGSSTYTFDVLVNGDTTPEPNETFFVNVTNVTNAILVDGQGQGTIINEDYTPIHEIQGSGNISPLSGSVTTQGIVTGLVSNGFFIQAPEAEYDADPNTSEGIFVFTSSAPPAAAVIGNRVQVVATISEFIPPSDVESPSLTELTFATVTLISTGNALPAPVLLTAADTPTGASLNILEKYEGMRVQVNSLTVIAPTSGNVNEANATATSNGVFYGVINGVSRPFREPGIEADNIPANDIPTGSSVTIPPVPRFDANTERIRVDSDGQTGTTQIEVGAGAILTSVIGPLTYSFRTYTILPDLATPPAVSNNPSALPVRGQNANEYTIASFNLERFFDTTNDPLTSDPVLTATAFNNRLNKASLAIRNVLMLPDILGIVEMENLTTLQALATKINNDAVAASQPNPNYQAYLIEGNDVGGIDVGFLVKGPSRVNVISVTQAGLTTTYINPNNGLPELLNDRPPLVLKAEVIAASGARAPVTVIVNHLRSLSGIVDPVDGNRIRTKRRAQAEFLANLVQARQIADPNEKIVLVGDFNAFQFNDGFVDSMNTIKGTPTAATDVVQASPDLVNPNLINLVNSLSQSSEDIRERPYSFVFDGNAQVLDHILITQNLQNFNRGFQYARLDADFPESSRSDPNRPERISDHDAPVAYFSFPPLVSINNVAITEGTGGTTTLNFTVSISEAIGDVVTVQYTTVDGSALAASDYTASTGTVTFDPMNEGAAQTISIPINPDCLIEGTETFTVKLLNPVNASLDPAASTGTGTINDDDLPGTISIAQAAYSVNEGGTVTVKFIRTGGLGDSVSFDYAITAGTATQGTDYTAAAFTGTITFGCNETEKSVVISTIDDNIDEPDETVNIAITNPTNGAALGTMAAVLTILDNDAAPTVSVNNVAVTEGDSGTVDAVFTVLLSNPSSATLSYTYQTADQTATAPADYQLTSGSLSFAPGETSKQVIVKVTGDTLDEADETFLLKVLENSALVAQGTGTILDDDDPPTISVNDVAVTEGNSGATSLNFTVSLSAASSKQITVNYATANNTATEPSDYTKLLTTTLIFAPNETSKTVTVTVNGDLIFEADETLFLNLTTPLNATIAKAQGIGTINNDDAQPTIAINDVSDTEGNSGTKAFTFTVTLSTASSQTITVNYATASGSATAGSDYAAIPTTTLTFAPGETSKPVAVTVTGDTLQELDEDFFINLTAPVNATIAKAQGIGTINNDDAPPTVTVNNASVAEGNVGTTDMVFTVTLSAASALPLTFSDKTIDGTATAGSDYVAANSTLTFAPGETSKQIIIQIIGDVLAEGNETFQVEVTGPVAPQESAPRATINEAADQPLARIAQTVRGTGTIIDDDSGLDAPGTPFSPTSELSDQKAGSVLIFPVYSSSLTNPGAENTRLNLTNTNPREVAYVHLFFVDGSTCAVADSYICLTPNQTTTLNAADIDPGVTGYVVAVAVNKDSGCPISFNFLIGDEYVKFQSGHAANLGAEAFAALFNTAPTCAANTAELAFDGVSYNRAPRVLAVDSIPSQLDGNATMLIVNRVGGDLSTNAGSVGSLFGLLYDELENPYSFQFSGGCQYRNVFSAQFPRTTPRINTVIPAGGNGWMKLSATADLGILGVVINRNVSSSPGAFNQGHNLHKLTLTSTAKITIPVFPPNCR